MAFSNRLQEILSFYDLNASSFADRVAVGRSSISHLLSGRNKPSLEFVMSVLKEFPEVSLNWLVDGKGSFPQDTNKVANDPTPQILNDELPAEEIPQAQKQDPQSIPPNLFNTTNTPQEPLQLNEIKGKNITKVILLYNDGSFSSYEPNL